MSARDERVDRALRLLAPPPRKRAECRRDIKFMLDYIDRHVKAASAHKWFGSKVGKASLRRFAATLRQLRDAHDALPSAIKPWFSLADTAYVGRRSTVVEREFVNVEQILARPLRAAQARRRQGKGGGRYHVQPAVLVESRSQPHP
jgi:hypothetical protein